MNIEKTPKVGKTNEQPIEPKKAESEFNLEQIVTIQRFVRKHVLDRRPSNKKFKEGEITKGFKPSENTNEIFNKATEKR